MSDTAVYIVTGILAVIAVFLFMRSGKSSSFTAQKEAEVKRKRAALIAKRKKEAAAREKSES
ncbi:MAG: hypothetical protein ABJN22_01310 [Litorimonas sp.]